MSDLARKPRWYRITPDRFLVGLLAVLLLVLAADRFELAGLIRGSGWNVLLAAAIVCLGLVVGLLWCAVNLLLRWRFQFSLKSMLLFTLIVAILCSWFAVRVRQAKRQEAAIAAIEGLGGEIRYHGDDYFRNSFEDEKQVVSHEPSRIVIHSRRFFGHDFLSPVDAARSVPGAALVHLKGLSNLKYLDIRYAPATDSNLIHLSELTNLRGLDLSHAGVTDAGLVHLGGLTNLELLDLGDTEVTDSGLAHLGGLTNLEELDLRDTGVTDAGLLHLEGLTQLEWLNLSHTRVADAGLVHLQRLPDLKSLDLTGTDVTDAGLEHLRKVTGLLWLGLPDTQVTAAGARKLQQALPNCDIQH